jgi:hypothetical protein
MPRARLLTLPCLLLLAIALAACGGAGGAGDADPAKAVPAGTAIYVEGVVRPEGDQRDDVLDAAGKVLRTDDPEKKIRELLDKGLKESDGPAVSYEKDIAPWLGERAGVWVTGVDRGKPGYVVLIAAKDTEKAQAAIDKGVKQEGGPVKERSYEGVDYQVDKDGAAAGIVGDYFTVGTEPEFKRTVKALDGDSLADDKRYKDVLDGLDDDRLGHFYVDLKPFVEQALKRDPQAQQQMEQIRAIFPVDKLEPMGGALLADGDRIAFDTVMAGPGVSALRASFGPLLGSGKTPLVSELPGDAWGAYGAPNVGPALKGLFDRVAGAFGGAAAAQQLQQQYGIDLQRDVFGWIGDIAIFVRGSDKASLEGGLVIKATNAGNMRSAFGKLVGLLQSQGGQKVTPVKVKGASAAFSAGQTGLGKPVIIARSEDRVVIGSGEAATADALDPAEKLGDSDLYGAAKSALGDFEPTFLLSMPDLVKVVEASGEADADFQKAKPYLEAFSVIASGGSFDDDELKSRLVAGLK